MYTSFKEICKKFGKQELIQSCGTYGEAKKLATDFQAAKEVMLKHFRAQGYSKWVGKPIEEEMFS